MSEKLLINSQVCPYDLGKHIKANLRDILRVRQLERSRQKDQEKEIEEKEEQEEGFLWS